MLCPSKIVTVVAGSSEMDYKRIGQKYQSPLAKPWTHMTHLMQGEPSGALGDVGQLVSTPVNLGQGKHTHTHVL